ncbi:MAG: class I SAM-dependent methyltransferase [Gammaproteobacteria bacterium]|nr:class I SAM-dependent methyltransferase [Gammaproteobacteria bacterium]MDH5727731.1 class I SAM-dependent methyltransferase [Gammaproteobacteria bacterium]
MKDFWNERYSEDGLAYGETPNEYLKQELARFSNLKNVLVVGDGEGRNGVWLAEQGLDVTTVDYSQAGVDRAQALAKKRQVKMASLCEDMSQWQWPQNQFDAVVSIYVHFPPDLRAQIHHYMLQALKPGGFIFMEAFNKNQLNYKSGGPPVEPMLFSEAILRQDFAEADIEFIEESVQKLDEGKYHVGDGAVVRMIARRRF